MLLVHGGNRPDEPGRATPRFPAAQVAPVTRAVAQVLRTLQPTAVVSAAAAGADLVVLGEAQRLGIPVNVVVPIDASNFVERSVADAGPEWVRRFEDVVAGAAADGDSAVTPLGLDESADWYRQANGELLALAVRLAAGAGEPLVALTVRPPDGETPPSVTDELADAAAAAGLLVLSLDPRPAAGGSPGVRLACTGPAEATSG